MADLQKATATQLANIEQRTGKRLDDLVALVRASGLVKHGELVAMLKSTLGMGHGDANLVVHTARALDAAGASTSEAATAAAAVVPAPIAGGADDETSVLDALYSGPKSALRAIHDALRAHIASMGPCEVAPKKTYVSYRRSRQFCMIGPATNSRVELGLNCRELTGSARLEALPAGQMCPFKVRLTDVSQVDDEVVAWLRQAYHAAG